LFACFTVQHITDVLDSFLTDSLSRVFQEFVDNSNAKIETMKRKKKVQRDDAGDAAEMHRMTTS